MRKLRGPMADWDLPSLLLRRIDLTLAGANWQRSGGKGRKPEAVPLPNGKDKQPAKHDGSTIARRLQDLGQIPADVVI